MLLPKTGPHAALGRSMERAARLAQGETDERGLIFFDTQGTVEGAATAAIAARRANATIILGPVFSAEVAAVLGVVGTALPVVTFSNDAVLLERGALLLGITARQVVSRILSFAYGRGIRRIAIEGTTDGWAEQAGAAAAAAAQSLGLSIYTLPPGQISAVESAAGGSSDGLPDAVLMTSAAGLLGMAQFAARQGIQLLGATQGIDFAADALTQIDGAWLAAPDAAKFSEFARAYEERNGSRPGTISGLAFDAVSIARQAAMGGGTDRSALLTADGFTAVCGDVRFREDGSAARALAILSASQGGLRTVSPAALG